MNVVHLSVCGSENPGVVSLTDNALKHLAVCHPSMRWSLCWSLPVTLDLRNEVHEMRGAVAEYSELNVEKYILSTLLSTAHGPRNAHTRLRLRESHYSLHDEMAMFTGLIGTGDKSRTPPRTVARVSWSIMWSAALCAERMRNAHTSVRLLVLPTFLPSCYRIGQECDRCKSAVQATKCRCKHTNVRYSWIDMSAVFFLVCTLPGISVQFA